MKAFGYLLFAFLCASCCSALSQKRLLKFQHLGTEAGLSQSNVTSVLQDSRGFMWFGTRDGLNKYDGYQFKVYKNIDNDSASLSNNFITSITEDADGNLWMGTWGGGVDMFNREKENFVHYKRNKIEPGHLSSNFINTLLQDKAGNLLIGTSSGGLNIMEKATKKIIAYRHNKNNPQSISSNNVACILEDSRQRIWLCTSKGLDLFNKKNKTFRHFYHSDEDTTSISSDDVVCIFEDSHHRFWVGTRKGGLDLFNPDTGKFHHYKNGNNKINSAAQEVVLCINEYDNGNLWLGTENDGLYIFDPATGNFINYTHDDIDENSISNSSIYCIYKDAQQNMWMGTYSGGVDLYNKNANQFLHYKHNLSPGSISNNIVLCIYEDDAKKIWIGTDGGGLNLMNKTTGTFTTFKNDGKNKKNISGNFVLTVQQDGNGNFWVGTWGDGITVMNKQGKVLQYFKYNRADTNTLSGNNAYTIIRDKENNMWVGTDGNGLNLYKQGAHKFIRYKHHIGNSPSISSNHVEVLFCDSNGNIWAGTFDGGLNLFDKKTNSFIHFLHDDNKNSISSNSINCMREDKNGNLWIGTSEGLNYFNTKTKHFTVFTTKDGLPNNMIMGILQDNDGSLWISTNNGLSHFNPQTKSAENYSVADGLQGNEFKANSCLKTSDGKFYFGGVNGLNEFVPENIKASSFDPPLALTSFSIFNKEVPIAKNSDDHSPLKKDITDTRNITLSYSQSVFSFQFATLNYTGKKRRYAYKLEGFDKTWNYIGAQRSATYTNLNPGEYTFLVKGLNNNGEWSSKILSVKLTVTPPYWRTWWFRLIVLIAVATIVITLYQLRTKRMKAREKILEDKVRERTNRLSVLTQQESKARQDAEKSQAEAEQANKAKSIFLATMSHEIRTPMNGVIGMAALLAETPLTPEQQEFTKTIRSCGETLLNVINDILDFSKIESGKMELDCHDFDLRNCIEEVLDIFAGKAAKLNLDLVYQIDHDVPAQISGDKLRLRQVLMNLVNNAIKFTSHGEIFVGVHLDGMVDNKCKLIFDVRDTGIGIPKDKLEHLFQAFSQVDSSTTRKYGGTGLGLAICEKLVALMGGKISAVSKESAGSTFTFFILVNAGRQSLRNYVHYNAAGLEGKRILIVDDNITNQNILSSQLSEWKFIPVAVNSAWRALDTLKQNQNFDLVLTDKHMPVMDGIELSLRIRQLHPSLPIILLSSVDDESKKNYPDLFSSILTKPVKQEWLHKNIISALRQFNTYQEENAAPRQLLKEDFAQAYPLRILIAEDNLVNQKVIVHTLLKLGYTSSVSVNGKEAINAITRQQYDLILMDIQMPEMDGIEATQVIRQQLHNMVTIIAMTANATKDDRDMCLHAGMNDYISKPVKIEELTAMLKKYCLVKQESL